MYGPDLLGPVWDLHHLKDFIDNLSTPLSLPIANFSGGKERTNVAVLLIIPLEWTQVVAGGDCVECVPDPEIAAKRSLHRRTPKNPHLRRLSSWETPHSPTTSLQFRLVPSTIGHCTTSRLHNRLQTEFQFSKINYNESPSETLYSLWSP